MSRTVSILHRLWDAVDGDAQLWRWYVAASLFLLGATVCLGVLIELPGRTTQHLRLASDASSSLPTKEGFRVGPLEWDLKQYEADPKLDALRDFFAQRCAGRVGLTATRCVSDEFARAFPHGPPKREFVDASYDPVSDLRAHMAGEPGHCVTRSGLLAAVLLSVGIPARHLEIVVEDFTGHNVIEVFDERWGWVLFDPTHGTVFETAEGLASARDVYLLGVPGHWSVRGISPAPRGELLRVRDLAFRDPWLYTRSGQRAAMWPFRGLLVHTGSKVWRYGPAQEIFRQLAGGLLVVALVCSLAPTWIGWRRRAARRTKSSGSEQIQPDGATPPVEST